MRTIKFRAWDLGWKKIIYQNEIEAIWHLEDFKNNNYIWMQYTGLKDKNGKEIYGGDILRNGGVVVWNESCACFGYELNGEVIVRPWSLKNEEYEVIGNIYENKEMLK